MLTLILAYALLGFITLVAMLSVIDLADEPDGIITPECIVLVAAIWPLIWLKFAAQIAVTAFDDLRVPAQKWFSSFSRKPHLLGQRLTSARSTKLATRHSMS